MADVTWPLARLLLSTAFALWLMTEAAVKPVVGATSGRDRWWGKGIVGAAPYVLGVALFSWPGVFPLLVEIFGYELASPPVGARAGAYGLFAAFGATAMHALGLGPLLRDVLVARLVPSIRRLSGAEVGKNRDRKDLPK